MAGRKKAEVTDYIICPLSMVAIYAKPNEEAMLISQLLFGETARILSKKDKRWYKINTSLDETEGYVDIRQFEFISEQEYQKCNNDFSVCTDLCQVLKNDDIAVPITVGASLPKYDGMIVKLLERNYVFNGQAIRFNEVNFTPDMFEIISNRFLNAPYMYGGRSVFGVDNASFIQLVYKCAGLKMPRSIAQMALVPCQYIDFIELTQPGDLAFFTDKDDVISHVGILIGNNEILHVVEKVKKDYLDHEGIYDRKKRKYLYKLKYIARYK